MMSVEEQQQRYLEMHEVYQGVLRRRLGRGDGTEARDERVAEATAIIWHAWTAACQAGKEPWVYYGMLAEYAVRRVRSGRNLLGAVPMNEVMSPWCAARQGYHQEALPSDRAGLSTCEWGCALCVSDRCTVADEAAFRIDYAAWLRTLTTRERRAVRWWLLRHRTKDIAERLGVSASRVSQMRVEIGQRAEAYWF